MEPTTLILTLAALLIAAAAGWLAGRLTSATDRAAHTNQLRALTEQHQRDTRALARALLAAVIQLRKARAGRGKLPTGDLAAWTLEWEPDHDRGHIAYRLTRT